jgi:hypothetical protein
VVDAGSRLGRSALNARDDLVFSDVRYPEARREGGPPFVLDSSHRRRTRNDDGYASP